MCGYLGQISNQKIDKSLLEHCNENIVCRGPDEKKAYFVDSSTQNSGITNLNIGFIYDYSCCILFVSMYIVCFYFYCR